MGAVFALLFLGMLILAYKRIFKRQMRRDTSCKTESYQNVFRVLIKTIVPELLSTTIYKISAILDQGIYKNVAELQGYKPDDIDVWWGIFSGKYKTIINIPISIASAMAASCVPNLTGAYARKDRESVRSQINIAIRFIMVIAFPCTIGIAVLSGPILKLLHLYGSTGTTAATMLTTGAVAILFYSLSTLSNGLLQGINRMREPVKNAAIALGLHLIVLLVMMFGLHLGIYAVVYSNALFAFFMCLFNAMSLRKYSGYRQEDVKTFLITVAAFVFFGFFVLFLVAATNKMGGGDFGVYNGIFAIIKVNAVAAILAIGICAVVYGAMLLLLKGLSEEELKKFPKGYLLVRIAKKLHLL